MPEQTLSGLEAARCWSVLSASGEKRGGCAQQSACQDGEEHGDKPMITSTDQSINAWVIDAPVKCMSAVFVSK